jgi:hypothetical protein
VEKILQQQDFRANLSDYDYVTWETVLQKLDWCMWRMLT